MLGCDSVLELDGEVHGKPADAAVATPAGSACADAPASCTPATGSSTTGTPTTAARAARVGATASTTVHFADLDDDEIAAYVATGEPLHVAGAFTLDGLGAPYVTAIEGDPSNVVGVSLPLLRDLLGELDVAVAAPARPLTPNPGVP